MRRREEAGGKDRGDESKEVKYEWKGGQKKRK